MGGWASQSSSICIHAPDSDGHPITVAARVVERRDAAHFAEQVLGCLGAKLVERQLIRALQQRESAGWHDRVHCNRKPMISQQSAHTRQSNGLWGFEMYHNQNNFQPLFMKANFLRFMVEQLSVSRRHTVAAHRTDGAVAVPRHQVRRRLELHRIRRQLRLYAVLDLCRSEILSIGFEEPHRSPSPVLRQENCRVNGMACGFWLYVRFEGG